MGEHLLSGPATLDRYPQYLVLSLPGGTITSMGAIAERETAVESPGRVADILTSTTYAQISRDTGIVYQHISHVFRGERNPSLELSSRLAQALGVSLDELAEYLESVRMGRGRGSLASGHPREHSRERVRGYRALSQQQAEEVRGDLQAGKSYREIARDRGVSRQTVSNIARGLHYPVDPLTP